MRVYVNMYVYLFYACISIIDVCVHMHMFVYLFYVGISILDAYARIYVCISILCVYIYSRYMYTWICSYIYSMSILDACVRVCVSYERVLYIYVYISILDACVRIHVCISIPYLCIYSRCICAYTCLYI